jgi:hypothetical protein
MVSKAPTNVGIEVKDLTNFSTLVWTAPEGKSVYGYHILVRETSSTLGKNNFCERYKAVIPYSKDNFCLLLL